MATDSMKSSPSGPKKQSVISATVTSGSLTANAITTVTGVTASGVRATDVILAFPDATLLAAGASIVGAVATAADTVSVSFLNPTGSAISSASYTLNLFVQRLV